MPRVSEVRILSADRVRSGSNRRRRSRISKRQPTLAARPVLEHIHPSNYNAVRHGHSKSCKNIDFCDPFVLPPNPPGQRGRWVWVTEARTYQDYLAHTPSPEKQVLVRPRHLRRHNNSPMRSMWRASTPAAVASMNAPEIAMHRRTVTGGTSRLRPRTGRKSCMDGHATKPSTVCRMGLSKPEGPDNLTWSPAKDSGHDAPTTSTEAALWSSFDWTPGKETSTASPVVPARIGLGQFEDCSRQKSAKQRHRPARPSAHSPLLSTGEQKSLESKPLFSTDAVC